jgi:hypothetical protein
MATNTELERVTHQRMHNYKGCAIVEIRHLVFEEEGVLGSKPFDQRNVQDILQTFEMVGCQNLEPEHRVSVIISDEALKNSLERSQATQNLLMDCVNPPTLKFDDDARLVCIHGKHRLRAGELSGTTTWLADLYLDGK